MMGHVPAKVIRVPFAMVRAPFVVSLSNHGLPFDKLRANGVEHDEHSLEMADHQPITGLADRLCQFVMRHAPFVVRHAPFVVRHAPFVVSLSNHDLRIDMADAIKRDLVLDADACGRSSGRWSRA
ncbi:MAG: hypothetical protein JSR53_09165 [Proteobacteria bacterium]|nr:hypothetical protein [Pseudomonadota bacterium]